MNSPEKHIFFIINSKKPSLVNEKYTVQKTDVYSNTCYPLNITNIVIKKIIESVQKKESPRQKRGPNPKCFGRKENIAERFASHNGKCVSSRGMIKIYFSTWWCSFSNFRDTQKRGLTTSLSDTCFGLVKILI